MASGRRAAPELRARTDRSAGRVARRGFCRAAEGAVPRATSSIRNCQQLGGSFGGAILAVVLQQQITNHAASGQATTSSLAAAYAHTFWWALAFTAAALLPALLLPSRPATEEAGKPTGGGPAAPSPRRAHRQSRKRGRLLARFSRSSARRQAGGRVQAKATYAVEAQIPDEVGLTARAATTAEVVNRSIGF